MAVSTKIPVTLEVATAGRLATEADAEAWLTSNQGWLTDIIAKHDAWLKSAKVELLQAAYDGELDEIANRKKARGDGTENKLIANYIQPIIDTLVDYMLGKSPVYTVEDPDQEDDETEESTILTEYRKKVMKLLKEKSLSCFSAVLRGGCIAGYGGAILWVDEKGRIDYDEYPVQELIPVYDGRRTLRLVLRRYDTEDENGATITKLEIYDDRYVIYAAGSDSDFHLDEDEKETGNPIEHKAGRIPVAIYQNQLPAKYKERIKGYGKSDLAYGALELIVAYCHGISDKANLMEYLQDQYLLLTGVDVDENEVLKMRKARALALKNKESKAEFIAQDQADGAIENGLTRQKNDLYDTTNTPRLSELQGSTATEIKMKYSGLDIKAGKKEPALVQFIKQFTAVLTDFLNAQKLIEQGEQDTFPTVSDLDEIEKRVELYQAEWLDVSITRNLPQNYEELANIVSTLSGIVPRSYLYELLWFIDDPQKAIEEMDAEEEASSQNSLTAIGLGANNLGGTGGTPTEGQDNKDQADSATGSTITQVAQ